MKVSNLARARAAFRWLDKQIDAAEDTKYSGKVQAGEFHLKRADNEIELSGPALESIPDVDEQSGTWDVELFDAPPCEEVEMTQFQEPEFEGTDEIVLEDPFVSPSDLDVRMVSNQDIEL